MADHLALGKVVAALVARLDNDLLHGAEYLSLDSKGELRPAADVAALTRAARRVQMMLRRMLRRMTRGENEVPRRHGAPPPVVE